MEALSGVEPRPPLEERDLDTRLADIRLLVLEFEGVVTDGLVLLGPDGSESISYNKADLLGLKGLANAGVSVMIMARAGLPAAKAYCKLAGVELTIHQDDKDQILELLAFERGIKPFEVLYMGADLDDINPMFQVGVAACSPQASRWVATAAHIVTDASAGAGALREICDTLLACRKAQS